jgi:hypothetical protein
MAIKTLTKAKLREFIADEAKAVRDYEAYGLYNLAKDEMEHFRWLKSLRLD